MKTQTTFSHLYNFPGFRARAQFKCGVFQDSKARVVELTRRQKKRFVPVAGSHPGVSTTVGLIASAIWMPEVLESTLTSSIGGWNAAGVTL
jgi:hypothetical protein